MKDGRIKNSLRNSFWGTILKILTLVCPFIFRTIIIRYIGAAYIGLNGLFKSIFSVLNMTELGFGTSIVFMMYKPIAEGNKEEINQLLSLMRTIYRIVGAVILTAGLCIIPFLDKLVKNDTGVELNIYLMYCLYLFRSVTSYWLFAYRSALLSAHQRSDVIHKVVISCDICMYLMQAAALYFTRSYYVYLIVHCVMGVPQNIVYYIVSKKMYPDLHCKGKPTKEQLQLLKSKVMPLLAHRIGGKVIISIDDLIISMFLGVTILTKYDNYYYVMSSIVAFLNVFRHGVMASFGNKMNTDSIDQTYIVYRRIIFIWMAIVGWCAACLAGLYQPFIQHWVGTKYQFDSWIMLSLVAYFFLWQFRKIGEMMKDSAGMWEPDRLKPIIGMVLNFGLSALMVKVTGTVVGVLYPTMAIMLFLYFPWETHVLFKHLFKRSAKDYLLLIGHCFLAGAAATAASYFVGIWIGGGHLFMFLVRGVACAATGAIVFIACTWMRPEFREVLKIGVSMLQRKGLVKK